MKELVVKGFKEIKYYGWQSFFKKFSIWFRSRINPVRVPVMVYPTIPPDQFDVVKKSSDYVRHASWGLAIQSILRENIPGDMAEAGVYNGKSSRFIHIFAPEKVLYLFDTFEGFTGLDPDFRETSVQEVLKLFRDPSKIVIKKGIFPTTTKGMENHRFAFVSLDMDLYDSILDGWKFFYPRVSKGGYIFVHDYNSPISEYGTHRATNDFLADKPEKIIELPDRGGTALIRKL
jgi:O-methyltransferase